MTLFPGGRSRVRQMAKAILLSEVLRWRQENGRRKCQYKCVWHRNLGRIENDVLQGLNKQEKPVSCFLVKVPHGFRKISILNSFSLLGFFSEGRWCRDNILTIYISFWPWKLTFSVPKDTVFLCIKIAPASAFRFLGSLEHFPQKL